jgi:hypothetical protein
MTKNLRTRTNYSTNWMNLMTKTTTKKNWMTTNCSTRTTTTKNSTTIKMTRNSTKMTNLTTNCLNSMTTTNSKNYSRTRIRTMRNLTNYYSMKNSKMRIAVDQIHFR